MRKHLTLAILPVFLIGLAGSARGDTWSIEADYAEACNCNIVCPCLFGSPATNDVCQGIGLVEIRKGHYGDVRLDGIRAVSVARMGQWVKHFVSADATEPQLRAYEKLYAQAFRIPPEWDLRPTLKAVVSVDRRDSRVSYAVPTARVEIERLLGGNGQPVRIQNLPPDFLVDYAQHRSLTLRYSGEPDAFEYGEGTNGFSARVVASGQE